MNGFFFSHRTNAHASSKSENVPSCKTCNFYGGDIPRRGGEAFAGPKVLLYREDGEVYPTLITPAGWAFGIWGAIFGLQGCFTAMQLLPQYRAKPLLVIFFSPFAACKVWGRDFKGSVFPPFFHLVTLFFLSFSGFSLSFSFFRAHVLEEDFIWLYEIF